MACTWLLRAALCLLAVTPALASATDEYILALEYETQTESLSGTESRSSSSGNEALVERIIGVTPAGTEIEYSIPGPPEDVRGNAMWMFPVRMLVAPDGGKTILNEAELSTRLDQWLAEAGWPRSICSQWLFTWTAVQIRCDPAAAIETVEGYGMRPGRIAEGEEIALVGALAPAPLVKTGVRNDRVVLSATAPVDPEFVREGSVESALAIAKMMGDDLSPEDARQQAAAIDAQGTLSVEFEVDAAGLIWKRTDSRTVTVTGGEHGDELRQAVQTVTRVSGSALTVQETQ